MSHSISFTVILRIIFIWIAKNGSFLFLPTILCEYTLLPINLNKYDFNVTAYIDKSNLFMIQKKIKIIHACYGIHHCFCSIILL